MPKHTIRPFENVRNQISFTSMVECGNGEFELVRQLAVVDVIDRISRNRNFAYPDQIIQVEGFVTVDVDLDHIRNCSTASINQYLDLSSDYINQSLPLEILWKFALTVPSWRQSLGTELILLVL